MATARDRDSGSEENVSNQDQGSDFSGFDSDEALFDTRVLANNLKNCTKKLVKILQSIGSTPVLTCN